MVLSLGISGGTPQTYTWGSDHFGHGLFGAGDIPYCTASICGSRVSEFSLVYHTDLHWREFVTCKGDIGSLWWHLIPQ